VMLYGAHTGLACSAVRHDAAAHFTATNGTQKIHKRK